jgi:hypothetical protein
MKENKTSKLLQDYRKQAYTKTRTDNIVKWNHPIHYLLYMNLDNLSYVIQFTLKLQFYRNRHIPNQGLILLSGILN